MVETKQRTITHKIVEIKEYIITQEVVEIKKRIITHKEVRRHISLAVGNEFIGLLTNTISN